MGVRIIDKKSCIGCGQCVRICPQDVLRMGKDKKPVISYLADCQSCFVCELYCPAKSIFVTPHRERRSTMPWICG